MNGLEGRMLGEFRLLTKVGQGGMGTVYLAEQPALNRRVAVKVLLPDLAHDAGFPRRFQREAMLAASINHPGLVQVHAAGETDGIHYIAMEYVDGESLQRRFEREGRLKPDDALDVVTRLARALDYAWQKARLVHRDIKPSNVLISTEGEVKLADFGMARNADCDSSLTATGMPIGTPLYISPEQARCTRDLDFTSDIYSLGCTLYHLISGRAPYVADASFAVMLQHVTEPPPSITAHMPDCPEPIVRLLDRMLAKDPKERHASYAELIEELEAARGFAAAKPARKPRRALAIAAVALLIGMAWYFGRSSAPVARPPQAPTTAAAGEKASAASTAAASETSDPFVQSVATLPAEEQLRRVVARLKELNPEFDTGTVTSTIKNGAVTEFACSAVGLTDVAPIRALGSLKRLELGRAGQKGAVASLSPLRGLALDRLEIETAPVRDLSPLRGMPLRWLDCHGSLVSDLSPLEGMPLVALGIDNTRVTDLGPLRGMPLKFLNIGLTRVSDLAPLAGLPLTDLNCSRTPVRDLSPLAGMALTRLICDRASITDLTPLHGMPLREIACDYVHERDAEILRSITTLETINGRPAVEFWQDNP